MKRIVLFLLCGLFGIGTIFAQKTGIVGTISWTLVNDNELRITGTGLNGEGDIPEHFFSDYSFDTINRDDIESIVIEDGIASIGNFAFVSYYITSVSIPASVTAIDTRALRSCDGLISILVDAANPVFYSEDEVLINKINKTLVACPAGKTGDYTVPDAVEIIGDWAFWECGQLTSVFIPQSVVTIGDFAFSKAGLTSVTIHGSTLTTIGMYAFQLCTNLISVSMPNVTVEHISNYAFSKCTNLPSFKIPASVRTIGEGVFENCHSLISVTIPGLLTTVGALAFMQCEQLPSVTIPASVTNIGNNAFSECNEMTSISVAENNMDYSSVDGVLFNKGKTTLIVCPAGKSGEYVIPGSVEIIESAAFYNCKQLTSVIIPASVSTINNYAFSNCDNLSEVVNLNMDPQIITPTTFDNSIFSTCILRIPAGSLNDYLDAEVWKEFINKIPLNVGLTLDEEVIYLMLGATTALTATVSGDVTMPEVIRWETGNTDIATVDNTGMVTAVNPGSTVITVSFGDLELICAVTVVEEGASSIEGTVHYEGAEPITVYLYMKLPENKEQSSLTKAKVVGGYVLLTKTVPKANGQYSFENLPIGTYLVDVEIHGYESELSREIKISVEEIRSDINFTVNTDTRVIAIERTTETDDELTTGVNEFSDVGLSIYPNPFYGLLHIEGAEGSILRIFTSDGKPVHIQTVIGADETIQLEWLPIGMYIIHLENGGRAKTIKVIKN